MIEKLRILSPAKRKNAFAYPAFLLAFAFFAAACTNSAPVRHEPDQSAATRSTPAAETPNANQAAMTNAGQVPYRGIENVNPNAFNAANDNLRVVPVDQKSKRLGVGERSGPDDSFITVTMNQKGEPVETRTFRSHPQIARVEKITVGTQPQYKVYLRSGRAVPAPADKMENFTALAPENILDAIGLLPKPEPVDSKRGGEKTDAGKQ